LRCEVGDPPPASSSPFTPPKQKTPNTQKKSSGASRRRTYGAVGQAGVADAEVLLDALHGGGQVQRHAREGLWAGLAYTGGDHPALRRGAGLKFLGAGRLVGVGCWGGGGGVVPSAAAFVPSAAASAENDVNKGPARPAPPGPHLHFVGDLLHHVERHVVAQPRVLVDQRVGARCLALRL